MLRTTALGLAAAASLALAGAALTPAFANYAHCDEQPMAKGCPGYIPPVFGASDTVERGHASKQAGNPAPTPANPAEYSSTQTTKSPNYKSQY